MGTVLPLLRARYSAERQLAGEAAASRPASVPARAREAARIAAVRNAKESRHLEAFVDAGWAPAQVEEPDREVQALDRAAWSTKEAAIQLQLQTDLFEGSRLARVKELAIEGPTEKTRFLALEALGRANDTEAQGFLIEVHERTTDEEARERAISMLRPVRADDDAAKFLFGLLDRRDAAESAKRQAVASLAAFGFARGGGGGNPPEWLLTRVPSEWRDRVREAWRMLRE